MISLEELMKQREELESKIKQVKESERTKAINEIKRLSQLHGLSAHDVFDDISIKVEPRYINPLTGEKWSGRGKTPKWLEGKNREEFEIK
jgi:DNA-binding protein H-NS